MPDQVFFNGSGGCEQCQSMTGCYDVAPRPHPECDCPIGPCDEEEDECYEESRLRMETPVDRYTIGRGPGRGLNTELVEVIVVYFVVEYVRYECCLVVDGQTTNRCWTRETLEEGYEHRSQGIVLEQEV